MNATQTEALQKLEVAVTDCLAAGIGFTIVRSKVSIILKRCRENMTRARHTVTDSPRGPYRGPTGTIFHPYRGRLKGAMSI